MQQKNTMVHKLKDILMCHSCEQIRLCLSVRTTSWLCYRITSYLPPSRCSQRFSPFFLFHEFKCVIPVNKSEYAEVYVK